MLRTELVEVQIYARVIRSYSDNGKEISFPIRDENVFFVYILECVDNSFYVGFSDNVQKRLLRHNKGEGAEYTQKRLPVKLIYCEVFNERCDALKRERQLKGWSRKKKVALVCKNLAG